MNEKANYKLNIDYLRDILKDNRIKISEFQSTFAIVGISQRSFDSMISKKNINKKYSYKKFETLANGINSWFKKEGSKKRVEIQDFIIGNALPEDSKIIRSPMKIVNTYSDFPWFMLENNTVLYNDGNLSSAAATGFESLMQNFIDTAKNPKYFKNENSQLKNEIERIKKNARINDEIAQLSDLFGLHIYTCELKLPLFNFSSYHYDNGKIIFQTEACSNYYAIIFLSSKLYEYIHFKYKSLHTLDEINKIIKKNPFDKEWPAHWDFYEQPDMEKELMNKFRIEALKFYDSKNIEVYDGVIELFGDIEKKNEVIQY